MAVAYYSYTSRNTSYNIDYLSVVMKDAYSIPQNTLIAGTVHFFASPEIKKRMYPKLSNGLYRKGWSSSTSSSGTWTNPFIIVNNPMQYLTLFSLIIARCSQARTLSLPHTYKRIQILSSISMLLLFFLLVHFHDKAKSYGSIKSVFF